MCSICRDNAIRVPHQGLLAMQKVVGSNPISRFEEVPASAGFRAFQPTPSLGLGGLLSGRWTMVNPKPAAGKHCEGLVERASDDLFEHLDAAVAHVE
jgi:hypothetical protein